MKGKESELGDDKRRVCGQSTKITAGLRPPDIVYIVHDSLKVACRIVRTSDEDIVRFAISDRCIDG